MTRPRILMADDHAMLLDALRALLDPEFDVVGTVTDGRMLILYFLPGGAIEFLKA